MFDDDTNSSEVVFTCSNTDCSSCILGDRCRGNLEHRQRGGESVLRKVCDTRASTSCQPTLSSSSSLPFVVCSIFYCCKIIIILFICNIEYINSRYYFCSCLYDYYTPIFYLTKSTKSLILFSIMYYL